MHLIFDNESDFGIAEYFKEVQSGQVEVKHENWTGRIWSGFTRTDEEGNTIDVWQKLLDLEAAGTINVQWLTQADKDAIQAEQDAVIAKQQERQDKLSAFEFKGVTCSVCEADQNGWETLNSKIQRELAAGTPWKNIPFWMDNGNHVIIESAEEWQAFIDAGWDAREAIMMARLA